MATKTGGVLRLSPDGVQPISAAEGLPSNTVNALCPHAQGGMWIATSGGLTLVTAVGMRHFSDSRLREPGVYAVHEDSEGTVWVGALECLQTLSIGDGTFKMIWSDARGDRDPHTQPTPDRILRDRHGNLWVGAEGKILRLRDGQVDEFSVQLASPDRRTKTILEDRDGRLWVVTGNSVHLWVNDQFTPMDRAFGVEDTFVNCMTEDAQGHYWIGSRHGGLSRLKPSAVRVFTKKDGLPHANVRAVSPKRAGGLWVAASGGVGWHDTGAFEPLTTPAGRVDFNATTVCEDSFGALWCTTAEGALLFIRRTAYGFAAPVVYPAGIANLAVWQDAQTNLWVGGSQALCRLLPRPGLIWAENLREQVPTTHSECWTYAADKIQRKTAREHWCFDRKRWWNFETILPPGVLPEDLTKAGNDFFTGMLPRREPANYDIRAILRDREDTLWFATYGGGLQRFRDNEFVAFATRDGLASDKIRCLHEGRDGALWIGTDQGLTRMDVKNQSFASVTSAHGLIPQPIYAIVEDDLGAFWISIGDGIYRVNAEDLNGVADGRATRVQCLLLDEADGILSGGTDGGTQPAACKTSDGLLWFATSHGLVRINPAEVRPHTNSPHGGH